MKSFILSLALAGLFTAALPAETKAIEPMPQVYLQQTAPLRPWTWGYGYGYRPYRYGYYGYGPYRPYRYGGYGYGYGMRPYVGTYVY